MNNLFDKGARPIRSQAISALYQCYRYQSVTLQHYLQAWRDWLTKSKNKSLLGLDGFKYGDYTQGTSQTFDQFILRHSSSREIAVFDGEFKYHACVSKKLRFKSIGRLDQLQSDHALIISVPFSDLGSMHPDFSSILKKCQSMGLPVCLDLAYWGISKNINVDLRSYDCVQEITSSLSKPFFTLENHRVGVRFSREYLDDGISMINEVDMQNFYSMSLGIYYMERFDSDWNWQTYQDNYYEVCQRYSLSPTDTVIFGTSTSDLYKDFNRGRADNNRVCITKHLTDIK